MGERMLLVYLPPDFVRLHGKAKGEIPSESMTGSDIVQVILRDAAEITGLFKGWAEANEHRHNSAEATHQQWREWANAEWKINPRLSKHQVAKRIRHKYKIAKSINTIRQAI